MSFFKCRIETFQPDTRILAGELPVNLGMNPIPKRLGLIRLERLVKRTWTMVFRLSMISVMVFADAYRCAMSLTKCAKSRLARRSVTLVLRVAASSSAAINTLQMPMLRYS